MAQLMLGHDWTSLIWGDESIEWTRFILWMVTKSCITWKNRKAIMGCLPPFSTGAGFRNHPWGMLDCAGFSWFGMSPSRWWLRAELRKVAGDCRLEIGIPTWQWAILLEHLPINHDEWWVWLSMCKVKSICLSIHITHIGKQFGKAATNT